MEQGQKISLKALLSHLIIPIIPATTAQPLVSHAGPGMLVGRKFIMAPGRFRPRDLEMRCHPLWVPPVLVTLSWCLPPSSGSRAPTLVAAQNKLSSLISGAIYTVQIPQPFVRLSRGKPCDWLAGLGLCKLHKSIHHSPRLDSTGLLFNRVEIERDEDRSIVAVRPVSVRRCVRPHLYDDMLCF